MPDPASKLVRSGAENLVSIILIQDFHFGYVLAVFAVGTRAAAIENQRVVVYLKMEHLTHHILNGLNPRIAELHHFVAIGADQVIVLFEAVGLFVLRQIFAKLMLRYQVTVHQYIQRIVHRGPAHPVLLVFHADVEFIHIKMIAPGVNLLQNRKTLGCLTKAFVFQVSRQDFFCGFQIVFTDL